MRATGDDVMWATDRLAPRLGRGLLGEAIAGRGPRVAQLYNLGVTEGGGEGLPKGYELLLGGVTGRAGAGIGIGFDRVVTGSGCTCARGTGEETGDKRLAGPRV